MHLPRSQCVANFDSVYISLMINKFPMNSASSMDCVYLFEAKNTNSLFEISAISMLIKFILIDLLEKEIHSRCEDLKINLTLDGVIFILSLL